MQLQPGVKACQSCGHQVVAFVVPKKKMSGCAIAALILFSLFVGMIIVFYMIGSSLTRRYNASITVPGTKWQHGESTSKMGDPTTYFWIVTADNEVKGWLSSKAPVLYVQCGPKNIDVYVKSGMQSSVEGTDNNHTVRIRYDDAAPVKQHWHDSLDGQALFAPSGAPIAKKLLTSKAFAFEFTPFNASDIQVATFDVHGLREAIGDNKACSPITGVK
jgi:hypothetical protein